MRIALLVTCVNDAFRPEAAIATVRLLERLGHEVAFDARQTCCGQMHLNSGFPQDGLALARRTAEILEAAVAGGAEAVVSPSGSCVAMLRVLAPKSARASGDEALAARLESLPLYELCEFLVARLGIEDVGASFPHAVAYHPSCHAMRLLRIGDAALRLLRRVRGLELREIAGADECCGFGGTFSVKNPEVSAAMLTDKRDAILATEATVVTGGDSSCLLHIGGGLSRAKSNVRTVHIAEILASTEPG